MMNTVSRSGSRVESSAPQGEDRGGRRGNQDETLSQLVMKAYAAAPGVGCSPSTANTGALGNASKRDRALAGLGPGRRSRAV
jgi:hypothetical protein